MEHKTKPKVLMYYAFEDMVGGPLVYLRSIMNSELKDKFEFVACFQNAAPGGWDGKLYKRMVEQIRREKPDIVHVHGLQSEGMYGVMAARKAGCKHIVTTVHGFAFDAQRPHSIKYMLYRYFVEPWTLRKSKAVYCVCKYASDRPIMKKHARKHSVGYIHNAVPDMIATRDRATVRGEYGIADEDEDDGSGDAKLPKDVKKSLVFLLLSVAFWYMAYNAVTSAFSKYATEMWGMEGGSFAGALMIASIGALISFVPVGIISSKLGRKKVILFGVALLAAAFATGFFFKSPNFFINIVFFLVGVAWASINVNSYPMVVEMCKGSDIGKFTGMYYTFSMAAQVLTPVLSGAFLEHVGYWTLFPYAAVFSAIAFCTMLMVKHGDSKPMPAKSALEAFDVED